MVAIFEERVVNYVKEDFRILITILGLTFRHKEIILELSEIGATLKPTCATRWLPTAVGGGYYIAF